MGTQRGAIVPSELRSTLMNIFRIGLNVIVVSVLYNIDSLFSYVWAIAAGMLLVAAALQHGLMLQIASVSKEKAQ